MLIEQLQKYMIIIVYTHREQPRLHTYVHQLLLPYERGKLDDRVKVLRWKVQPNPWSHSRRRQNERQIVETYHNFEVNEDSAAAAVRRSPPGAKTAVAVLFSPRTWHPEASLAPFCYVAYGPSWAAFVDCAGSLFPRSTPLAMRLGRFSDIACPMSDEPVPSVCANPK